VPRTGAAAATRAKHEVVHELRIAEADLELRRMRVDVDASRIERQVDRVSGLASLEQHVLVAEPHGMSQQLVANETVVDESELHVGLAARERRRGEPAAQRQAFDRAREIARVLHELFAADRGHAALLRLAAFGSRQGQHRFAVAREPKLDVETREREIA
jgi:hypothetical protein